MVETEIGTRRHCAILPEWVPERLEMVWRLGCGLGAKSESPSAPLLQRDGTGRIGKACAAQTKQEVGALVTSRARLMRSDPSVCKRGTEGDSLLLPPTPHPRPLKTVLIAPHHHRPSHRPHRSNTPLRYRHGPGRLSCDNVRRSTPVQPQWAKLRRFAGPDRRRVPPFARSPHG
ncbi:hypothetical protein LC55x_0099 [Lysobacter capsici]|nr:hypothetical protein LC55x_0099 [Lysobacter capsici]